jgi:hypothetical protein
VAAASDSSASTTSIIVPQGSRAPIPGTCIKDAIQQLPEEERTSLAAWLNEMEYDEWDKQMEKDFSPGGRGAHLLAEVNREIADGKCRPMEEGLRRRPGNRS